MEAARRYGRSVLKLVVCGLALTACEPSSVFEVDEFGEIRYSLDLTGIPAEDSDPFRIHWQHLDFDDISGGESFSVVDPPEFSPRPLEQIPVGRVRVSLTRLPRNCSTADAEKTITVEKDVATPVTFVVACR